MGEMILKIPIRICRELIILYFKNFIILDLFAPPWNLWLKSSGSVMSLQMKAPRSLHSTSLTKRSFSKMEKASGSSPVPMNLGGIFNWS